MEFILWHYSKGVEYYITSWLAYIEWVFHYFSLPILIRTLFSPWKRLVEEDTGPGFNPGRYFRVVTFNLISRGIGAVVRTILLIAGALFIVVTFIGGIVGLLFWFIIPFFGVPVYKKYQRQPKNFMDDLVLKIKSSNKNPIKVIFENEAGKFFLAHTGLELNDLVINSNLGKIDVNNLSEESFEKLIEKLVKAEVWTKEYLRKRKLVPEDLILTADWWETLREGETKLGGEYYNSPGIGRELLFGYTPTLNQYSIDLSTPQSFSHRLIGRENVVSRMERVLTSGKSVLLIGQPGVGKKTVVLEFAHRAAAGEFGSRMAYRRVLEFDYNALLSKATDLNQKKTTLANVLSEASAAGNIVLMVRDIQRLTHPDVEGYDFTDVFEKHLAQEDLEIVAVSTPTDYERFVASNLRLKKHLEPVEVEPPSKEEAMQILVEAAQRWERVKNVTIMIPALRKILDESDRYITETPFPEKAIELLDAVVFYIEQSGKKVVDVNDANKVLSERIGVSFDALTKSEKARLGNLEETIHERLVNQDTAVDLIGKTLRARTVGVTDDDRPLGSFLFMGPTGVGKTETAKVLARVYYGSRDKILRFDMAEYSGREGLERLIGSVDNNRPGALTTAIKNNPASLLLLDEIEKASPEIFNLFLSLLDEGYITDAFGKRVKCSHLFVIGTSNAGTEQIRQLVKKGVDSRKIQEDAVNFVLEQGMFSPEFLNRFDGVVVYEPLQPEHLVEIAHLMLGDLKRNLKKKGVSLQITDETAKKLAEDGFDPAFGARPMRRIVDIELGDLIGKAILSGEVKEGDTIKIIPADGKLKYAWEKVA